MDGKNKTSEENIIAQFRIVDTDKPTAQEIFLEDYHNCPLCGSELLFTHVTHFLDQQVKEEAACCGCNIKIRSEQHGLQ